MTNEPNRYQQQTEQGRAQATPTGVRLQHATVRTEELGHVSHIFLVLQKHGAETAGAALWRDWTQELNARLDEESQRSGLGNWLQDLRLKFMATDSPALRAAGYLLAVLLLLAMLAAAWLGLSWSGALDGAATTQMVELVSYLA